jgi:hypothetical protein
MTFLLIEHKPRNFWTQSYNKNYGGKKIAKCRTEPCMFSGSKVCQCVSWSFSYYYSITAG